MASTVYILRLAKEGFYVGSTDKLERRLKEHQSGIGPATTARAGVIELVYSEELPTRSAARLREMQIKRWTRAKKEALIQGELDRLHLLAKQTRMKRKGKYRV